MKHVIKNIFRILCLLSWGTTVHAIIGYDCGSNHLNITTLSLLEVGECDIPEPHVQVDKVYVQLLQLSSFTLTKIIQCKIEVDRVIEYCGMHSHTSTVTNGFREYIQEISREQCNSMHNTGIFMVSPNIQISGLKVNRTSSHSVILAGSTQTNGQCAGSQYSDLFGTWENVIVHGKYRITLQEYYATINLNTDKIQLKSGIICPLSETQCTDELGGGQTFWNALPNDNCNFQKYSVLYEGPANRTYDNSTLNPEIIYSLTTDDITFVLAQKAIQPVCNFVLIRTEHPKLLIYETTRGNTFIENKNVLIENMDLFTYVNSKFVYVEKHLRKEMNRLYYDLLNHKCRLEQQVFKNSLIIATQSPDEFAYHLMKGPGYMSIIAGEVAHIIKCIPVEVKFRQTEECYLQIPVTRGNDTSFLTPRTHILMNKGTQTTCNIFLPLMYYLNDAWYKLSPRPIESLPPSIMKPTTKPTWKYTNPASLATSGIYTQSDLDKLRDHIMFPAEKPAILNSLAREILGQSNINHKISLMNLLDEETLDKIAQSAWGRFWTIFSNFGTASAGFIGIIIIIRTIKLIADTIIHGYALYSVFGYYNIHL